MTLKLLSATFLLKLPLVKISTSIIQTQGTLKSTRADVKQFLFMHVQWFILLNLTGAQKQR